MQTSGIRHRRPGLCHPSTCTSQSWVTACHQVDGVLKTHEVSSSLEAWQLPSSRNQMRAKDENNQLTRRCNQFATTRCRRCNLAVEHDDESCTRCPAKWLREKTGVDETGNLGTRSHLLLDDQTCTLVASRTGIALAPQISNASHLATG